MAHASGWSDSVVNTSMTDDGIRLNTFQIAERKAQIVFIPGHWHTLFFTRPLVASVEKLGHKITPSQLASVGRKILRPTFSDDVNGIRDAVLNVLEKGDDAILVLHSYAGMPGSEAVNQLIDLGVLETQGEKGNLRRIVYIAAYMFPAGFKMDAKMFIGDSDPMFSIDDNTGFTHFSDPYTGFFNDMSREDAQPYIDQIGDTYYLGADPCITSENWRKAPLFYIQAERDQAMPIDRQVGISQGMPSVKLNTGHDPFVSRPDMIAEILGKLASSK